jgi:hypothetical protein
VKLGGVADLVDLLFREREPAGDRFGQVGDV